MHSNESCAPRWSHLQYTWKLENFWELRALASIEALEDDGGDVTWSRSFGDKERGFWRLKLYPYGDSSPGGRGHISLFLSLDVALSTPPKVYAIFGCYVLDKNGAKIQGAGRSFTRQKFAEGTSSWGWSQFVKVDDQTLNGLLVGDTLTVKCDLDVFLGVASHISRPLPAGDRQLELLNFARAEENQDVELKGKEDATTRSNFFLLAARSEYFRNLYRSAMNEETAEGLEELKEKKREWRITLPDLNRETLQNFVTFVAESRCDVLEEFERDLYAILPLLRASKKYQFQGLQLACEEKLLTCLVSKDDANQILDVATDLEIDVLMQECKSYLKFWVEPAGKDMLTKNTAGSSARVPQSSTSE